MHHVKQILVIAAVIIGLLALAYYAHGPSSPSFASVTVQVGTTTSAADFTSGVRGTVLLGPTCPVAQNPPAAGCTDKPYQAAVSVYKDGSTKPLANMRSRKDGSFEFGLASGSYRLSVYTGSYYPHCPDTSVTVPIQGFTTVTITCDSGIR